MASAMKGAEESVDALRQGGARRAGSRPRALIARQRGCAAALAAVAGLAGCHAAVLNARGPVGHADATILVDSLAIMLAIVVPTILATLGFAWWYRAGNARARHLPEWSHSGRVELVVWAIPAMVIILLGGVSWIGSHELDPARPLKGPGPALDIQVVSLDWKWLFIYPKEGVASVNELVVPAGVPLHFSLTSASVMNSFFVPELGSMIYTMNGMVTQLNLMADAPGTFQGRSAHYSGDGFSDMHFQVRALTAAQFAAWIDAARGSAAELDRATYEALQVPAANAAPVIFGRVAPELFRDVATQVIAPAPGPAAQVAAALAGNGGPR
jgi:cytochrome o ubiquinol oxidase subunit 2